MEQRSFQWAHDHIHMRCRDVEATAQFYAQMFGARVVRRPGGGPPAITEVDLAGVRLFLSPADESASASECGLSRLGVWQLGFAVKDLDVAIAELKAKGAAFPRDPVILASGARAGFFEGPDGLEIELIQRP